jgi:hypothetical protein
MAYDEDLARRIRRLVGWLRVRAEGVRTSRQLSKRVDIGTGFAQSLPAKR